MLSAVDSGPEYQQGKQEYTVGSLFMYLKALSALCMSDSQITLQLWTHPVPPAAKISSNT